MEQCVYYGEAITKAKTVHVQKSNHDSDKRVEKGGNVGEPGNKEACMMTSDKRFIQAIERKKKTGSKLDVG